MTLVPSRLTIAGTAIALDEVLAELTIHHGRADVMDDPTPSTCQVTLIDVDHAFVKAFQIRQPLVFSARNPAAPELVTNPGAEVDGTGWFCNAGTITRDTARAHSGTASFKLSSTSGGTLGVRNAAAFKSPPRVGVPYEFKLWVYAQAPFVGRTLNLQLTYSDLSTVGNANYVLAAGWNLCTVVGTFTDTTKMSVVYHRFTVPAGAAGELLWFDDGSVKEAEVPRFTGTITDASLNDDELTAIAVGALGSFDQYPIGAVDWPAETWSARVTRCFTEAGLASLLVLQKAAFDPLLVARTAATAGPTTLRDYLGFLAPMVGAAVVDRPDGKVLVQAIGARTLAASTRLDPALVAYVPPWVQDLPHGNVVTVRYTGDQSQSVTVQDDASIALYKGRRPVTIDTTFQSVDDATVRANERLSRTAFAHWNMPSAPVLAGLDLAIGAPVQIDTFPDSAPFDPWQPILEGWQDTISGPDWTMALALSDPLGSGLLLPWNAIPAAGYAWNQIKPATAWKDALTIGDLAP